jgi:hypothetical protein
MSARNRATGRADGVRYGLVAAAVVGVAALVLARFSTVIRITVGTATRLATLDTSLSGWDRHGPALLVVAGFAVLMVVGAARGARPAMVAVLVCGVMALSVALALDAPHLDDTGQVGELYVDASAGPGWGSGWRSVVARCWLSAAAGFSWWRAARARLWSRPGGLRTEGEEPPAPRRLSATRRMPETRVRH